MPLYVFQQYITQSENVTFYVTVHQPQNPLFIKFKNRRRLKKVETVRFILSLSLYNCFSK